MPAKPREEHLRELLSIYRQNLQVLELQRAQYGLSAPIALVNQLADVRQQIELLSTELASLAEDTQRARQIVLVAVAKGADPEVPKVLKQEVQTRAQLLTFGPIEAEPDMNLCFVLMPFAPEFDEIYEAVIFPTVTEKLGMKCARADQVFSGRSVMDDLWGYINRACVIIAELTGRNPNVLYELGLCHAIGKPVVMITQSMGDVPFDVRHLRCVVYKNTIAGSRELQKQIVEAITYLRRAMGIQAFDGSNG